MARFRSWRAWGASLAAVLLVVIGLLVRSHLSTQEALAGSVLGLPECPALQLIREMQHGQGVTALEGRHMYDLIVSRGYRRGLEIGTAQGYSSLWFGMALERNRGSLVTIEIDPATAAVARANFRRAELAAAIELRTGDAFVEVPRLAGDFDFVFLDTGTPDNQRFLDLLGSRIPVGGAILAHNATWMRWQQPDYWKSITTRPEYETTVFERVAITLKRR